jgi:Na+-transporting NADH:ubiquinone oxidoreductase subunit C
VIEVGFIAWWRRFLALPNDSRAKTLGIAFLVALSCSLVVSSTAVTLRPLQEKYRLSASHATLLNMLEVLGRGIPQERLVDLVSGDHTNRNPGTQSVLTKDQDSAGLGTREDVATVFELRRSGDLQLVILPVRGSGYQSMLKGYLALEADLNTVAALIFYEQDETPGLGSRIEEDGWRALWSGKQIADVDGAVLIEVVKGVADGIHEVDGITGATRTGSGVTNLLRFWLSSDGYGNYLARLRSEAGR